MESELDDAKDVDSLIAAHRRFVDIVLETLFLDSTSSVRTLIVADECSGSGTCSDSSYGAGVLHSG